MPQSSIQPPHGFTATKSQIRNAYAAHFGSPIPATLSLPEAGAALVQALGDTASTFILSQSSNAN